MSSFLVFDHKTNYCGMNKLIPGARLTTFTIWHCTSLTMPVLYVYCVC